MTTALVPGVESVAAVPFNRQCPRKVKTYGTLAL